MGIVLHFCGKILDGFAMMSMRCVFIFAGKALSLHLFLSLNSVLVVA